MSLTQKWRADIIADCYKDWVVCGRKVLDVGCGNAVVSDILRRRLNLDLCGTDIIDYRKINIPFKKMQEDTRLPFTDLSFDYVMFNDILHHSRHIEEILREGSRVASALLIFEDSAGLLLKIVDKALNYFYSSQMPCPLNFKPQEEWRLLFNNLGFECEVGSILYPVGYPFRHMAFKLSRAK